MLFEKLPDIKSYYCWVMGCTSNRYSLAYYCLEQ